MKKLLAILFSIIVLLVSSVSTAENTPDLANFKVQAEQGNVTAQTGLGLM